MFGVASTTVNLNPGTVIVRQGKGRRQRLVFLGARSREAVLNYLAHRTELGPEEPLWPGLANGKRLTDSGLRQLEVLDTPGGAVTR